MAPTVLFEQAGSAPLKPAAAPLPPAINGMPLGQHSGSMAAPSATPDAGATNPAAAADARGGCDEGGAEQRPRRGSIDVSGMYSREGMARHLSGRMYPGALGSAGLPSGATDVSAYCRQQAAATPPREQQQQQQQQQHAPLPGAAAEGSPVNAAAYFSQEGATREQGTLRSLAGQFAGIPGIVSLSGGFPSPSLFPFAGITLRLADGGSIDIGDVQAAQQYNFSLRGYQPLLTWAEAHVAALHAPPPGAGHQCLITNGGNHTLEMIFALFCDRGDSILLEEYSYPVVTESLAQPKGLRAVPVPIDERGIVPEALEALLAELAAVAAAPGGSRFPKLLYTVPTGQNPTGCTITPERRAAVYRLCQRYGLLLVEDDPYFYLQYGAGPGAVPGLAGLRGAGSYLSLDVDGRVMRVDSFAKFLAPGLRLGWVTASPQIANKLTMTIQSHTVGPCSLSQVVTAETLAHWGEAGLDAHLRRVQAEYASRAACIAAAARQHLAGLAESSNPTAGMFLWLRLLTVQDASEIWEALRAAKVVLLPGRAMHCRASDPAFRSPYMRVSFSNASLEELAEGMRRLGAVLREHAAAAAAGQRQGGIAGGAGGMEA